MKFSEDLSANTYYHITGYGGNYIAINHKMIRSPTIISPKHAAEWSVDSFESLEAENIQSLVALNPEVIIIGTGEKQILPSKEVLKSLVATRIGFEIMDTSAACRTYNVLVGEGRKVVAGLFIIES